MSIYVDKRGGGLIIERQVDGRRFRRATGLPDTPKGNATAAHWEAMVLALAESGRTDLVWQIGQSLTFADIWQHYRTGAWNRIPSAEQMKPLFPAAEAWIPLAKKARGQPVSETHRRDLRRAFKALKAISPKATVADLPALLLRYRGECERRGIGRTFHKVKSAVQSFLRENYGKRRSMLWAEVSDIPNVPWERDVMLARTITQALEIEAKLPPVHAKIWGDLWRHGLMPDELWGQKWRCDGDGLRIGGTKTDYRPRVVPLLQEPTRPERRYKAFREALQKVQAGLTPYVARRTYGRLLEEAGIAPTRARHYMGHRAKDPHELYPEHDVTPHLAEDRAVLEGFIGFEQQKGAAA